MHGMVILLLGGVVTIVEAPRSVRQVIEFEVQALPPSALKLAGNSFQKSKSVSDSKAHRSSRGKSASLKGMSLFRQSYNFDSAAKNSGDVSATAELGDFKDSASYALESDSFIGDNDQWAFYRQVFERIDSQLLFDSLLAQYSHFGSVFVEFEVDPQGRFVESKIKVSAEDKILQVHALRALTKGLKESFKKEKWNPSGKNSILHAKFDYVFGESSLNYQKQREFGKPIFLFKRATSEKPIPNNLKDQLLNGGVSYDPVAMTERWQKYNKKKRLRAQEFDPFASYKNDPLYNL